MNSRVYSFFSGAVNDVIVGGDRNPTGRNPNAGGGGGGAATAA
jgi:hypothetical protein